VWNVPQALLCGTIIAVLMIDPAFARGFLSIMERAGRHHSLFMEGNMNDFDSSNPFFQVDLLTGCSSLVSFFEVP